MDETKRQWESAVDAAEAAILVLPENAPLGATHTAGERKWQRAQIVSGAVGGRWAYWKTDSSKAEKQGPNAVFEVIADRIFNHNAFHFAGMLELPYTGRPMDAWVLIEPKIIEGPRVAYVPVTPLADGKRYERSREVYDVLTKETKILP